MPTEVSFYHLSVLTIEKALPRILEKALFALNKNILIRTCSSSKMSILNEVLWTFSTKIFLPHGSKEDPFKEKQPIYLTDIEENPNNSEVLVALEGYAPQDASQFIKIIDIFDGSKEEEIIQARNRWKKYKEQGLELTYWQQNEKGQWEKN